MRVHGLIVEVTLRPLSACSTTDDPIKQISRADVLNLTSTEAGHNHPKLYKALLEDVEEKPASAQTPPSQLRKKPHLLNIFFALNYLPVRRAQSEKFYGNKNAARRPHSDQNQSYDQSPQARLM